MPTRRRCCGCRRWWGVTDAQDPRLHADRTAGRDRGHGAAGADELARTRRHGARAVAEPRAGRCGADAADHIGPMGRRPRRDGGAVADLADRLGRPRAAPAPAQRRQRDAGGLRGRLDPAPRRRRRQPLAALAVAGLHDARGVAAGLGRRQQLGLRWQLRHRRRRRPDSARQLAALILPQQRLGPGRGCRRARRRHAAARRRAPGPESAARTGADRPGHARLGAAVRDGVQVMTHHRFAREAGAALLTAMLTVTLVATFAAAALWQQWRSAEIEAAERARAQAGLVLIGALDWSRLILREDARASGASGGADHLAEPWAVPLEEAKLTTFLTADKNIASDALEGLPEAYLSGRIIDAQSKLNVLNLVNAGKPVAASVATFTKLFQLLNLPAGDVALLTQNLQQALPANASVPDPANTPAGAASAAAGSPTGTAGYAKANTGRSAAPDSGAAPAGVPLVPQRIAQLVWLGLSPATVAALEPY